MARVLVIDDDDGIREMLHLALTSYGHVVTTIAGGAAALASLDAGTPDVILLDLHLRSDDRPADAIRSRTGAPIILMSASEPSSVEARSADRWLAKPFDLAQVLDLIADCTTPPR